jgi:tripartite-type tricarboxylate transporter receptor subunit TctC
MLSPAPAPARAVEAFPTKPIRLVIPFPPGGANDVLGRLIAQAMSADLGQSVYVENRGGAGGTIGAANVAHAPPDGYSLLYTSDSLAVDMTLYHDLPYKADDLVPITLVAKFPVVLVVNPKLPVHDLAELVALSKSRGGLTYGSTGSGSSNHLTGVLLNQYAGLKNVHIPYKGAGPMMVDVVGGQIDMATPASFTATAFVKQGQVRAVAVTGDTPLPGLPGVAPLGKTYPGVDTSVYHAFFTTKGTPPAVVQALYRAILKAMQTPKFHDAVIDGGGIVVGDTPEHFAGVFKSDISKYADLVKSSGAQPD